MRAAAKAFLELIYPKKCVICESLMDYGGRDSVCPECKENLSFIKPDYACKKCGKPIVSENKICDDCFREKRFFKRAFSAFSYEIMREPIERFKFRGFKNNGYAFAELMNDFGHMFYEKEINNTDVFIPVPMFPGKEKIREFNQSNVLSKELSRLWGKEHEDKALLRIRDTKPQMLFPASERKDNIKDAFAVKNPERISGKRILLIDDIFTTGSTVNECSRELLDAGALDVTVFTLSITPHGN